jgi:hypothetical protein
VLAYREKIPKTIIVYRWKNIIHLIYGGKNYQQKKIPVYCGSWTGWNKTNVTPPE